MNNSVLEMNHDKCTSCGMCSAICPKNAIQIKNDLDGFYRPEIDEINCISCGICKKNCIKFEKKILEKEVKKIYAMKTKNMEVLKKSSSGGISYELMKACIENGYSIVGVSYDLNKDLAITKIVEKFENLDIFFGSKYMQSYTENAFKDILKNNENKKYAIFSTPCHIYSLNKYSEIKNNRENYIFIDLFCHGCPSLNLWKKYLEMIKRRVGIDRFDSIEFRSKINGWHEYAFLFKKDKENYPTSKFKNEFCDFFFNLECLNEACYNCQIKGSFNYTDIRLGDFWGPRYDEDVEGISAVIGVTDRGISLIEKIKLKMSFIEEHSLDEVLKSQSSKKQHQINKERRRMVLNLLKNKDGLEKNHYEYLKTFSVKKKIKILVLRSLKLVPEKLFVKIRKLSHKNS